MLALDNFARGFLERSIDETIEQIPTSIKIVRSNKAKMHVKEETDYVFGLSTGYIMGKFEWYYRSTYFRFPSAEESNEGAVIILRRSSDIRNAIFAAG